MAYDFVTIWAAKCMCTPIQQYIYEYNIYITEEYYIFIVGTSNMYIYNIY